MNGFRKISRVLTAAAVLLGAAYCCVCAAQNAPNSIEITPSRVFTVPNASVKLSAVVKDSSGQPITGLPVSWSVIEGTGSGTISSEGLFTGKKVGDCEVKASAGTVSASVRATVLPLGDRVILSIPEVTAKPGTSAYYVHIITSYAPDISRAVLTLAAVATKPANAPPLELGDPVVGQAASGAEAQALHLASNVVRVQIVLPSGISGPGILVSFPISHQELPGDCEYRLELRDVELTSSQGTPVPFDLQPGSLKLLMGSTGPVASVKPIPPNRPVRVGQRIALEAKAFDASGNEVPGANIVWSLVEGGGYASVTERGILTAAAPGVVRLKAASGEAWGEIQIEIVEADNPKAGPVVSVPILEGAAGTRLVVPIIISEVDGLAGAEVTLAFDEAVPSGIPLLLPGQVELGPIAGGGFLGVNRDRPGRIGMAVIGSRDMSGPGVLFKLTVDIPPQAPGGATYLLKLAKVDLSDAAGNSIPASAVDGAVVIPADVVPPTAKMKGLSPGAVVGGVVSITGEGGDNASVVHLELLVDGTTVASYSGSPAVFRWDTRTTRDGTHTVQVRATDASGNYGLSAPLQVVVDNTAPTVRITSPKANSILSGKVGFYGTADDPSLRFFEIRYGSGSSPSQFRAVSPPGSAPVREGLLAEVDTSLLPDGAGEFRLVAEDLAGNSATFSLQVRLDNTPPSIAVKPLAGGEVLRGDVPITAEASDASGVAQVQFILDGSTISSSTLPPYRTTLKTQTLSDGPHTLKVRAVDTAGNSAEALVPFVVDNTPPVVSLSLPSTLVAGVISISGKVVDANPGSYRVEYGKGKTPITWNLIASGEGAPSGEIARWNASALADGIYQVRLVVEDKAGNVSEAVGQISLDNTAPSVLIRRSPTEPVSKRAVVEAEAADASGIAETRLLVDQAPFAKLPGGATVYRFEIDTSLLEDGRHEISVEAVDPAGNVGSDKVWITADNTPPAVLIESPKPGELLLGSVQVRGRASDQNGLKEYALEYGSSQSAAEWVAVQWSPSGAGDGLLGVWDLSGVAPGAYILRLRAADRAGNEAVASVPVVVAERHHGDVNGDGRVTVADAVLALRLMLGLNPPTERAVLAADTAPPRSPIWASGDGRITVGDVILVLRRAIGLAQ
jgi:hypothetical protein